MCNDTGEKNQNSSDWPKHAAEYYLHKSWNMKSLKILSCFG